MATILGLPREIRDLIYTAVLDSELSPPSSPAERRHERKQIPKAYGSSEYYGEHCNQYLLEPVSISSSGLLRTNPQVRIEMLDVIARRKAQKQLRYKIDCMIEDEKRLYPTWLSVPAVSFHIDTVEVNFRFFGQCDDRSGFTPEYRGPGYLIWSMLALLNRFLERGPNFLSPFRTRQKIEVELIVLNVVTPSESAEGFDLNERKGTGVIRLWRVLHNIMMYLDMLLHRTGDMAKYAKTVYGGVRRIKLTLDGETRMEWDLVAMEAKRQRTIASSE